MMKCWVSLFFLLTTLWGINILILISQLWKLLTTERYSKKKKSTELGDFSFISELSTNWLSDSLWLDFCSKLRGMDEMIFRSSWGQWFCDLGPGPGCDGTALRRLAGSSPSLMPIHHEALGSTHQSEACSAGTGWLSSLLPPEMGQASTNSFCLNKGRLGASYVNS